MSSTTHMKDRMAFYGLLQDLSNTYSVLSNDQVTEEDYEDMKYVIVHTMNNEFLRNYVMNQEPANWRWNNDMLRVQLREMAREQFKKFLALSEEQQASYRDCFTMMRSIEVFKLGQWKKAGQLAEEINHIWSGEQRIDSMSEDFKKKWLEEIRTLCLSFINST